MASIKSLGNGKFQATISAGFDGSGKRKRVYKTFTAKDEATALKKAHKLEGEVEKGSYQTPSKYTFATYTDEWRKSAIRELAPKTLHRYEELLRIHILPQIGNYKLEKINAVALENAYDEIRKPIHREYTRKNGTKGSKDYSLSESTLKHIHRLISAILNKAYKQGLIRENPCSRVTAPKVKKLRPIEYNKEQISAMIEALESAPLKYRACVHLTLATGLRLGELTGLQWGDIDFTAGTLEVKRSAQYIPGQKQFLKSPKNETSQRVITLPKSIIEMLKSLEKEQKALQIQLANKWEGNDFKTQDRTGRLFVTETGKAMFPTRPSSWFNAFLKERNLPHIRWHDLRHISISYLIASGEDIITVSRRAGHSNSSTTLNVYGHQFRKRDEAAANKMEGMFSREEKMNSKAN